MLKRSEKFDMNHFMSENNQVKTIPIELLVAYHNHQFKLYSGERFNDMVESIRQNGVLNPILVQPIEGGKYEILSGHNRVEGAKAVGLSTVPAVVKENLSEEEAEMYVIETNLIQRGFNELATSEQAKVLQYHNSKMFSQGKRNDIIEELERLENKSTSSQIETKLKKKTSLEKVGDDYGMSRPMVARVIRVNHLIEPFKSLVDNKSMPLMVGVELSYIPEEGQNMVYEVLTNHKKKLNIKLSKEVRNLFASGDVTPEMLESLLIGEKPTAVKSVKVSLDEDIYLKYFDKNTPPDEVKNAIQKALEVYFKQ